MKSDRERELYDVSTRFENQLQEVGRLNRPLDQLKSSSRSRRRFGLGVGVALTTVVGAVALRRAIKHKAY